MRASLWITCLLLAGCLGNQGSTDGSASSPPGVVSDTTAAIVLAGVKRTLIDGSTTRLRQYEYVREREVSVAEESGETILRYSHTTRFYGSPDGRNADVLDTMSVGSQNGDFWAPYRSRPSQEDTVDWSRRLLEEDPVVLSRQGSAYYHYSTLTDTVISGARVMRIDGAASPGPDRAGIQWGRFYVEHGSNQLVGFELEFVQRSLLFDEESRFRYMLNRALDGTWIPSEVRISTLLDLPLSKGQHFELRAVYKL